VCRRQAGLPADLSRRYRLEKHAPIEHFPFPAQDLCYRLGYRNRQEGMEASHSRHHRQGQFIGTGPSSRPFLPLYASTNINHMQRQENLLQRYSSQNEINDVTSSTPKRDLKTLITISGGANSIRLPPPIATKKRGGNEAIDDGDKSLGSNTKVVLCDVGCSLEQAKEAHETCGLRPVSVLWLLDSISHFSPQPLNDYVVGVQ